MVYYTLFYCNLKTLQSKVRIIVKAERGWEAELHMKKIYSNWSKEVKKAMIDKDLTTKDLAEKFHWTSQYVSAVINGREYYREAVVNISVYLGVAVPDGESATLARKVTV